MQNIIQINKSVIGQESVNSVNAREVYEYLGIKTKFADWIKRCIDKYDFVENEDYTSLLKSEKREIGATTIKEYIVTLDMAKELCMITDTPKGKEVRKYFIEVEKKANKPMDILDMVIYSAQQLKLQQQAIKQVEDKVSTLEQRVEDTNGLVDYFTIIGYMSYRKLGKCGNKEAQRYGKEVSKLCREMGYKTSKVQDARYGTVKTYPREVLDEYFIN